MRTTGVFDGRHEVTRSQEGHTMKTRLGGITGLLVLVAVLAAGVAPRAEAAEYFVTPTGAGALNGSNWDNAFANLQAAVDVATTASDTIRMRHGVYSNLAAVTISARPGLAIVGGYIGNSLDPLETASEPTILTRDSSVNIRILDINASTLTVERITVSGGFMTTGNGAGIQVVNGSELTMTNCAVLTNGFQFASKGGGLYAQSSTVRIYDSLFSGNYLDAESEHIKYGGAMALENSTSRLERVQLLSNRIRLRHSQARGGALYLNGGTAMIDDCDFIANSTVSSAHADTPYGGALYAQNVVLTVHGSRFRENYAAGLNARANVMYLTGASLNATFEECMVTLQAPGKEQDIYLDAADSVTFKHSILGGGPVGAMLSKFGAGTLTVTNCLLNVNAGHALDLRAGTVTIANSTIADNGGWAITNSAATLTVRDSILWDNAAGDITGAATVDYSIAQSAWPGSGNLVTNPLFVVGYYLAMVGEPYQPESSPARDSGSATAAALGLDGRITTTTGDPDGGIVDRGYHYSAAPSSLSNMVLYVDGASGSDANDGWIPTEPLKTITTALERVLPGGLIHIAAGSYTNGSGAESLPLEILVPHVTLRGVDAGSTVIDGQEQHRVMRAVNPGRLRLEQMRIANGYLVNDRGAGLYLQGGDVTITNTHFIYNRIVNSTAQRTTYGGAIYALGATLSLSDCVFLTNRIEKSGYNEHGYGGAIYALQSGVRAVRCQFAFNSVSSQHFDNFGGALALVSGSATLRDCVFSTNHVNAGQNNSVTHRGGAIYASGVNPLAIEDSRFYGNYARASGGHGGVLYIDGATASGRVARCVFAHNGAVGFLGDMRMAGGILRFENNLVHGSTTRGLWVGAGTMQIENCTVAGNATYGLDVEAGTVNVRNSILWGNPSGDLNGSMTVSYSLATGLTDGVDNNLNQNPLLVEPPQDYRLQRGSPAINTGLNQDWMIGATDLSGELPRILNRVVDMGCYEAIPPSGTLFMFR